MNARTKLAALGLGLLLGLSPLLMAPSGGFPSRPTFQTARAIASIGANGCNTNTAQSAVDLSVTGTNPRLNFVNAPAAADAKIYQLLTGATDFIIRANSDDCSVSRNILDATRSGNAITSLAFGNATDNPTYPFLGTGATTFNGLVTASRTGTAQALLIDSNAAAGAYSTFARSGTAKGDVGLGVNCGGSFTADALCLSARAGFQIEMAANGAASPQFRLTSGGGIDVIPVTGVIALKGTTNVSTTALSYIDLQQTNGTELGYLGWASGAAADLYVTNAVSGGNIRLNTTGAGSVTSSSTSVTLPSVTTFSAAGVSLLPSEGTATPTLATGCTTTPAFALVYTKIGNMVTLQSTSAISCTSNSTTTAIAAAGLPTVIRPAANKCTALVGASDNSATTTLGTIMRIQADGGVNFTYGPASSGCSAANWTASGTKALAPFTVSYLLQ